VEYLGLLTQPQLSRDPQSDLLHGLQAVMESRGGLYASIATQLNSSTLAASVMPVVEGSVVSPHPWGGDSDGRCKPGIKNPVHA
jgi:hypothetical protein